jgi:hypothetical protein
MNVLGVVYHVLSALYSHIIHNSTYKRLDLGSGLFLRDNGKY